MIWTIVFSVSLSAFIIHYLFFKRRLPPDYPRGPRGLPILGNVLSIKPNRYVAFKKWGEQYGDVFSVSVLTTKIVVLHSIKAVREAFLDNGNQTSFREKSRFLSLNTGGFGIVSTDGSQWKEHRRFALRNLRDLGFAKTMSLDAVHQEVMCFDKMMGTIGERPVNTKMALSNMTANVISRIVFGCRLSDNDSDCQRILKMLMEFVTKVTSVFENMPILFPWLLDVPFFLKIYDKMSVRRPYLLQFNRFLKSKVDEHLQTIGEIAEPRDFTDALIMHKRSLEAQGQMDHSFNERSIIKDLFDLFIAGTDTTSVTLTWGVLAMALNPDIQETTRKEILDKIGPEALPTLQDRSKLNYTLAVIDEVARYGSIAPTAIPHRANDDIKICGFTIPKNSRVLANIYAIHHDEKLWKNPNHFDPNNFLDDNGIYKPSDNLIPFSLGKRSCLGESLARLELFVFFVALMQRYRMSLAEHEKTDVKKLLMGTDGLIRHLDEHSVIFKRIES